MKSIIEFFSRSKLTPLIVVASILLGIGALQNLPREEEPQIDVPMIDVMVPFPGGTPAEVYKRVVELGQRKLWEIPNVEYIYTQARRDGALFILRFKVGTKPSVSLVESYAKVFSNLDMLPDGAPTPLIKPRLIDDVPFLTLTFTSDSLDSIALRERVVALQQRINAIENISQTTIIGGHKKIFLVEPDLEAMQAKSIYWPDIAATIASNNERASLGNLNSETIVRCDALIQNIEDLRNIVVGVFSGSPVSLGDVASVRESPDQLQQTVLTASAKNPALSEAVTLAIAKRPSSNATSLSEEVLHFIESHPEFTANTQMEVTRDYGHTAQEKSDELLVHMLIAIVGVSILIAMVLGWRASLVVFIAIPTTLALTLASFHFLGYTLNRITLFALIFTIGVLVDDPIVGVENIVRFLAHKANQFKDMATLASAAMMEILSPLVLATIAVVSSIMPMAFVGGLMGPYMSPIPIGASIAMIISMIVSIIVTPWAAIHILRKSKDGSKDKDDNAQKKEGWMTHLYRVSMNALLSSRKVRWSFGVGVVALFVFALAMIPWGWVRLKMLPFDNKNEFQVTLNLPEGSTLDQTHTLSLGLMNRIFEEPEVTSVQLYLGTAAPFNFNGLVRHTFLKSQPHQAELQVNLKGKDQRKRSSHAIAAALRSDLNAQANSVGAQLQIAEIPPGPPVLSTIVVEIYGPDESTRLDLARQVERLLRSSDGITDVVNMAEADRTITSLNLNKSVASLNGITPMAINQTLSSAIDGSTPSFVRRDDAVEPLGVVLRLKPELRDSTDAAISLKLLNRYGREVALSELVQKEAVAAQQTRHSKNLMPVNYVMADTTDIYGSPVYAMLALRDKISAIKTSEGQPLQDYWVAKPKDGYGLRWDGEWQITYEVFRDLGIAFGVVMILIFLLVVGWFKSLRAPIVVMAPIPLSLIGIIPAHALTGIFFTATSMIGLIAGAGIVVRNAIILVDFIEIKLAEGLPLKEAVLEAGALRFRPMLLTAAAVVIGASVLFSDPIFQGLALALVAGEIASTLLSRTAVPVLYYWLYRHDHKTL